jgi:hypothetical protein
MSLVAVLHIVLHGVIPGLIAWGFFRPCWRRAWLIMLATMAVDLDHLLATPIYQPDRCSIGFHPLHRAPAIMVYGAMTLWPPTRLVGVGLVIHMALDASDCAVQRLGRTE